MKFRFIDLAKKEFPAYCLCTVLGVSQSGYFAWKDRHGFLNALSYLQESVCNPPPVTALPCLKKQIRRAEFFDGVLKRNIGKQK